MTRRWINNAMLTVAFAWVFFLASCGHVVPQQVLVTEGGLAAAAVQWDSEYFRRLMSCDRKYQPKTPEAETCFGPTYDADMQVRDALVDVVALMRAYWAARALGANPDWQAMSLQVETRLRALPPPARVYFDRVRLYL